VIPQNPIQGVITALYRAHSDGAAAQGVELLDLHICAVYFTVIVPSGVEGHHAVDDAARQVAVAVVEIAGLPGHRGGGGGDGQSYTGWKNTPALASAFTRRSGRSPPLPYPPHEQNYYHKISSNCLFSGPVFEQSIW